MSVAREVLIRLLVWWSVCGGVALALAVTHP